jgi:hypothetical protein
VAGQWPEYIQKQLRDFKAQAPDNDAGNMTSVAGTLSGRRYRQPVALHRESQLSATRASRIADAPEPTRVGSASVRRVFVVQRRPNPPPRNPPPPNPSAAEAPPQRRRRRNGRRRPNADPPPPNPPPPNPPIPPPPIAIDRHRRRTKAVETGSLR